MSPETLQAMGGLIALFGLVICFAGYRVFRAFLAVGGLAVGIWLGFWLSTELRLEGGLRWVTVVGAGLGLAWLAAGVYHAGLFLTGGAACAGVAAVVGAGAGHAPSTLVLGLVFGLGGTVTLLTHRRLVVYVTALTGGLLVMLGITPLMRVVDAPDGVSGAWMQQLLSGLSASQLGLALLLAAMGVFIQRRWTAPARLAFGTSRAETAVLDEPVHPPRHRSTPAASPRTHDTTCPRCGMPVDPDALFCQGCGNDYWGN
jgi:Domain of unknown function (DUF4203)